jgi:hypothetical protein
MAFELGSEEGNALPQGEFVLEEKLELPDKLATCA